MAKVSGYSFSVSVTPTVDTSAYGAGDQLGSEMIIDPGITDDGAADAYVIQSIVVTDKAKQSASIDLVFFDDSVTIASDNAAADFTDAQLVANCLGYVNVGTYSDFNDNSVGTARNVGLQLKQATAGGDGKIYCYAVSRGTPTYVSTTDLTFKFDLAADV